MNNSNSSKKGIVWTVVIAIVVIVAAIVYLRVGKTADKTSIESAASVSKAIPELGLTFMVPDSLNDLTYKVARLGSDQAVNSIGFGTPKLDSAGCSVDSAPLGYLTYDTDKGGKIVGHVRNSDLYYVSPTSNCKAVEDGQIEALMQALTSVQPSTPSSTSSAAGLESYTSQKYGFSFMYPTTWKVTESTGSATLSSDTSLSFRGDDIPYFEIVITPVKYASFTEQHTKLGDFKYDAQQQALVKLDANSSYKCIAPQALTSGASLPVFFYGGSTMSDPAYDKAVILTNQDYLLDLDISYETPADKTAADLLKNQEQAVLSSLNYSQARVPACSTQAATSITN